MLKRRITRLLLISAISVLCLSLIQNRCHTPHDNSAKNAVNVGDKSNSPQVSVRIVDNVRRIVYTNHIPFIIVCTHHDNSEEEYFSISEITVKSGRNGVIVYDRNYGTLSSNLKRIYFRQTSGRGIGRINGKGYRGKIFVFPSREDGTLTVINRLDVDSYLMGVLPEEMGHWGSDEYEALKAQAVAARTYALYKIQKSGKDGILESTVLDQVYGGYDNEDKMANNAVASTAGEVIMFNERMIPAYYFAACGGRTESIDQVWGGRAVPFSISIDDKNYCAWAKNYFWEDKFSRELLQKRLDLYYKKENGTGLPGILKNIIIITRSKSGRVKLLKIYTNRTQIELQSDNIRWAIRKSSDYSKILPSTMFDLKIERDDFGNLTTARLIGRGNGHGIGMCQCGALGRARQDQDYRRILSAYYPNTAVRKNY